MATTFGQFKSAIRARIWPAGSAEPDNLVASHDKDFVDALVDLQTWVPCLQQDNTDLYPQCSTTYNCGLTVLPAPRGIIKKVSVIDKIDPDTGLESADADDDYCSEIAYPEVDYCHVRRYLDRVRYGGGCCGVGLFFGLPFCGSRPIYPTPTDEGLAAGLPLLPMGFHYPQTSTDRTWGRAGAGVWAKQRGNIYVAPWIQSTETIIVLWDGIKRTWASSDPIDDDPLLSKAVEEYVRWQHSRKWDRDDAASIDNQTAYRTTLAELIHQCREETRTRNCEPSHARASSVGLSSLYYNDEQAYTAQCQDNETGDPVTVIIQSGTVGSNISVADANARAKAQATSQAKAQLVCSEIPTKYWNTVRGQYTAKCSVDGTLEDGAPTPVGSDRTVIVEVGTVSSEVSIADANTLAQTQAMEEAIEHLSCTYGNAPQTATKACADGVTGLVSITMPANSFTAGSQASADQQAMNEAQNQANALFAANNVDCGDGSTNGNEYNDEVTIQSKAPCYELAGQVLSWTQVNMTIPANTLTRATKGLANQAAIDLAIDWGRQSAAYHAANHECGQTLAVTYPSL